ncbi:MAG: hypothetical protein ABSA84_02435 [Gammaproteobacteria bacterium]|jgi:hypothetical protein
MKLTDTEINTSLTKIKQLLGNTSLAEELEMSIKHIPTYNKIIKTHIAQLQNVLASDKHNNKNLENINLSPTVKQLMNIFDKLQQDDLQLLEDLQNIAINWQQEETIVAEVL